MDKEDYYYDLFRQQTIIESLSMRIVEHVLNKGTNKQKQDLAKEVAELINGDKEWLDSQ
jgi:hypothetical protein